MKSRIVLKAVTITLMGMSAVTIATTVALNFAGIYPFDVMGYHAVAGALFLSVIPAHVYMMRQKLKKLSEQIRVLVATGECQSSCASQLLPNALNRKTLGEFCRFADLDMRNVRRVLAANGIAAGEPDEPIGKIASANHTDASRMFAIILQKEPQTIAAFYAPGRPGGSDVLASLG